VACGTALFGPPLATATLGALDDVDQGIASGANNAVGQLGGLLAIAVLPAAAGLSDAVVGGPAFAAGHTQALQVAAGLTAAATILAAVTLRRGRPAVPDGPADLSGHSAVPASSATTETAKRVGPARGAARASQ
jgi:hypothetical protein